MKMFRWIVAAALIAMIPGAASAQQTESRIAGKVFDQSQATLPGVTINVESLENGSLRSSVTDQEGSFTVTNLSSTFTP